MSLITYITVVRNGAEDIERTIESILPLLSSKVEYIIIDGGSKDGTLEKIQSFENKINRWISEPDKGIYDAMNKGLELAKGEFVCFINIGDKLLNCPLKQIEEAVYKNAAAISFPVQLSNGTIYKPSYTAKIKLENTLHHQGTYYRKNQIEKFNLSFKTFADFDLNQTLYKKHAKVIIDHSVINSFHSVEGISNNKKNVNEIFRVVKKNYGALYSIISFFYFKFNYGLKNKIKSLKL